MTEQTDQELKPPALTPVAMARTAPDDDYWTVWAGIADPESGEARHDVGLETVLSPAEDRLGVPTWWFPSLALLATAALDDTTVVEGSDFQPRELLDEFARARPHLLYGVVEELTDTNAEMTVFAWPIVNVDASLLFATSTDAPRIDLELEALQTWANTSRQSWFEAGLTPAELVQRPIGYGDTFALRLDHSLPDDQFETAATVEDIATGWEGPTSMGGIGEFLPAVDVSWDARQSAKLAHYAAASGTYRPEELAREPAQAISALEISERQHEQAYLASGQTEPEPGAVAEAIDARDIPIEQVVAEDEL